MIKVEHLEVWGFQHAIRGMRNPMNSWDRSDTDFDSKVLLIGDNDLGLMKKLLHSGTEHRKYLRMIHVSCDIIAPLYWWKEFDTYKVGTVSNSCSTMHKIAAKKFTFDDFSTDHLVYDAMGSLKELIDDLNTALELYLKWDSLSNRERAMITHELKDKEDVWWQMIQLLPSSYNQKRTVDFNYENAISMIHQRSTHKLDEWREFTDVLKNLPYMHELIEP